jgi:hypothetical protein
MPRLRHPASGYHKRIKFGEICGRFAASIDAGTAQFSSLATGRYAHNGQHTDVSTM